MVTPVTCEFSAENLHSCLGVLFYPDQHSAQFVMLVFYTSLLLPAAQQPPASKKIGCYPGFFRLEPSHFPFSA
jgi:hypothetical protein